MEVQAERMYSSYSFTTSALDGGDQRHAPRAVPPVPIVQEAGWAPEPAWIQKLEEKLSCLCQGSNLVRPVIQSVARHYTDWATPVPLSIYAISMYRFPFLDEDKW
jgi:hypothetical protein